MIKIREISSKPSIPALLRLSAAISGLSLCLVQSAVAQDIDGAINASAPIANDSAAATAQTEPQAVPQADASAVTAPELGGLSTQDPLYTEAQIQALVGPYALYPDDLLAIVLPASTYPLEIVLAARFLDRLQEEEELEPEETWDDSVVALLNYPEVIEMMNENIDATWQLGEAVISQQTEVLQAIENFRQLAMDAGNLESDERQTVEVVQEDEQEVIVIKQIEEQVVYVPKYIVEEVIVEQPVPVYHYHTAPRPVYYYPYPVGHRFHSGYFWGVTTAFSIGWSNYWLNVYHPSYRYHPYYGYNYFFDHYRYRRPSINVFNNYYVNNSYYGSRDYNRYGSHWRPQRHFGSRPYDRRYNNYYVGSNYGGRNGARNVSDFAADRQRSMGSSQLPLTSASLNSRFGNQRNRFTGDSRSGGRINGENLNDLGSDANALTAARANGIATNRRTENAGAGARGARQGNGNAANRFNALRGNDTQTTRSQTPNASALSTPGTTANGQRGTRQDAQPSPRLSNGASFDAFRDRARGRAITGSGTGRRIAPQEDSSALVAPSTQNRVTTPRATPRTSNRVQSGTQTQPRQENRRTNSGVNRFTTQRSQRSVGGSSVRNENRRSSSVRSQPSTRSQSSSRNRVQSTAPSRQTPSFRSNNNQRSSGFNSNRRGSSSAQRSQPSRPQISRPTVRSQPRANRSAAPSSSRRPSASSSGRRSSATGGRSNRRNN